jgi:hypothetical protein
MKIFFTFVLACFSIIGNINAQVTGVILDMNGTYLSGVAITNITAVPTPAPVTSDSKGKFSIAAAQTDVLMLVLQGYGIKKIDLTEISLAHPLTIVLEPQGAAGNQLGGSISSESYWVGAKVGYNFNGFGDDFENNFIGSAKILVNLANKKSVNSKLTWGIISNISDFITNENKEDANKNLEKIALSIQGFGAGIYWGQLLNKKSDPLLASRFYVTAKYRLNTFKNVGVDSITVNLSQFHPSVGFEFEGFQFANKGKLNISCELSLSAFSKADYFKISRLSKGSLLSFETNIILPLNQTFGFYSSGTFAPDMKPIFLFGVIVKDTK